MKSAAWSPEGSRIVATDGFRICIFDTSTGATRLNLRAQETGSFVQAVSFSPDGTRVACVISNASYNFGVTTPGRSNGNVKIRDAVTGAEIHTLSGTSASWSPDGSRLITGSKIDGSHTTDGRELKEAKIWDATTGAEFLTIPDAGNVPEAAWSPDGSRFIAGGKIWDARTGALLTALSRTDLTQLSWSPDGSRLVAPGPHGTTVVLDTASGVEVLTLKSPSEAVKDATWSADGSRIRAVSSDGTVRIWDARSVNPEAIPENVPLPSWLVRP